MENNEFLETVKAATGKTAAELARTHHIDKGNLSRMASGAIPIPDDLAAELAVDAGLNPIRVLADLKGGRWIQVKRDFWTFIAHANPSKWIKTGPR